MFLRTTKSPLLSMLFPRLWQPNCLQFLRCANSLAIVKFLAWISSKEHVIFQPDIFIWIVKFSQCCEISVSIEAVYSKIWSRFVWKFVGAERNEDLEIRHSLYKTAAGDEGVKPAAHRHISPDPVTILTRSCHKSLHFTNKYFLEHYLAYWSYHPASFPLK